MGFPAKPHMLYMQELVTSGLLRLRKVPGTLHPADVMTKNNASTHVGGFHDVNFFEVVA